MDATKMLDDLRRDWRVTIDAEGSKWADRGPYLYRVTEARKIGGSPLAAAIARAWAGEPSDC